MVNTFADLLLDWFDQHGRKDLPWQHQKTPYRVWVSEIMLQQTQVSTVIPYYLRFMDHFPTLESLALAPEDQVLHQWAGLGYYSRARNLHRAAQIVMRDFSGRIPLEFAAITSLPGIGRSTAGAILSIADNQALAILDGNVKRVLTRLHGIRDWPGKKEVEQQLWKLAEQHTPRIRTGDYTQAIMDLGATLCTRSKPRCPECPVNQLCTAHHQGLTAAIPHKKPKLTIPVKQATVLILRYKNQVLLQKRPSPGIWGGLWSFPDITHKAEPAEIKKICRREFNFAAQQTTALTPLQHRFTHFHLELFPVLITIDKKPSKIMAADQQLWYNLANPQVIGLPAPIQSLLRSLP